MPFVVVAQMMNSFLAPHGLLNIALAKFGLITEVCEKLENATLVKMEGGDHSFRVPKTHPISQADTHTQILQAATSWLSKQP